MKRMTDMRPVVLVDNGHGEETAGKRSPDGRLLEWRYTREIAREVVRGLALHGVDGRLLVPETRDVPLSERVTRANGVWRGREGRQVALVSIHVNAAGDGATWMGARGWSAYTSRGTTPADSLASCLYEAATEWLPAHRMRTDCSDGDADMEAGFYILRKSACPAVLTENLFMDNRDDMAFLLSDEGRRAVVGLHVDGIVNYLKSLKL